MCVYTSHFFTATGLCYMLLLGAGGYGGSHVASSPYPAIVPRSTIVDPETATKYHFSDSQLYLSPISACMQEQGSQNLKIGFLHRPNRHRGVIMQLAGRVEGGGDDAIGVSIRVAQPE